MDLLERRHLDIHYLAEMIGYPVRSYSISEGSKKGDNFIGKMLFLSVELDTMEQNTVHLVIKSLIPLVGDVTPDLIAESQFFNELQVFPTEIAFYEAVRPTLQQNTGYPNNTPRFYSGLSDGLNDYVVLEDLRVKGYQMADKTKGFNLEEVTRVFNEIALLHAHSYYLIASGTNSLMRNLQSSSVLSKHIWSRPVFDLDQSVFFNGLIQKMVEVVRETGDWEIAEKMKKFPKIGHKTLLDLSQKTGESSRYFPVVIMGDLWTNNILFKYSSSENSNCSNGGNVHENATGAIEHVTFIDYQQCRFGNIYEELLYFLFTSTTAEFRKIHLRPCLKHYFDEFSKILKQQLNNFPLPSGFTEEELIATFYENIEYGLCYTLVAIPFQLGEPQQHQQDGSLVLKSPSESQKEPPSALQMALMTAEVMKQGTKSSPIAVQRLKELVGEMRKMNVIN